MDKKFLWTLTLTVGLCGALGIMTTNLTCQPDPECNKNFPDKIGHDQATYYTTKVDALDRCENQARTTYAAKCANGNCECVTKQILDAQQTGFVQIWYLCGKHWN